MPLTPLKIPLVPLPILLHEGPQTIKLSILETPCIYVFSVMKFKFPFAVF